MLAAGLGEGPVPTTITTTTIIIITTPGPHSETPSSREFCTTDSSLNATRPRVWLYAAMCVTHIRVAPSLTPKEYWKRSAGPQSKLASPQDWTAQDSSRRRARGQVEHNRSQATHHAGAQRWRLVGHGGARQGAQGGIKEGTAGRAWMRHVLEANAERILIAIIPRVCLLNVLHRLVLAFLLGAPHAAVHCLHTGRYPPRAYRTPAEERTLMVGLVALACPEPV